MLFSKEICGLNREKLWTVPHLPEAMDSSWTPDLTTAAWITAAAVTHTDHSFYDDEFFYLLWGKEKRKKGNQIDNPGNVVPLTENTSGLDVLGEV